ncbi:MAG TPA: hypothetical protein VGC37_18900 [Friedmanniella sp.]
MNRRGLVWRRIKQLTRPVGVVLAVLVAAVLAGVAVRSLRLHVTVDATSSGWDVLTAVGTLGATLVALWLAVAGWLRDRTAGARLVSAWVTDDYLPVAHEGHYLRRVA